MVAGKSEKQQVIAFIDYENCSNLTEISLNIYTELIIFAGAKQCRSRSSVYATAGRRRNTILFPLTGDITVLSGHCRRAGFSAAASPRIRCHQ